jgi:hypothetical protein
LSGYNVTQSKSGLEFAGNLGDALLRLLVAKQGVLKLDSIGSTPSRAIPATGDKTVLDLNRETLLNSASRQRYKILNRIVDDEVKSFIAENEALYYKNGGKPIIFANHRGPTIVEEGKTYRKYGTTRVNSKQIILFEGWTEQDALEELVHFRQALRDGYWGSAMVVSDSVKKLWEKQVDTFFKNLGLIPQ